MDCEEDPTHMQPLVRQISALWDRLLNVERESLRDAVKARLAHSDGTGMGSSSAPERLAAHLTLPVYVNLGP
jgi:hypothetical protein